MEEKGVSELNSRTKEASRCERLDFALYTEDAKLGIFPTAKDPPRPLVRPEGLLWMSSQGRNGRQSVDVSSFVDISASGMRAVHRGPAYIFPWFECGRVG